MTPQELSRTPSGRMTAVMRAVTRPRGPVVLRVALVRGGVVIEERTLEGRADVTLGPDERSTFVLPERSAPDSLVLFDRRGGAYHIHDGPSMKGRITAGGRAVDLGGAERRRIPLEQGARGRVTLGGTTVLFQLAPAPPAAPRPALPASMRAGLADGVDWMTTLIAAFSFLVHFGAVGALWSDWMDPVLDDEVHVAQLVESLRAIPAPPNVEVEQPDRRGPEEAARAQAAERPGGAPRGRSGGRAGGRPGGGGKMSDAAAGALLDEMRSMDLAMVGALSSSGGAPAQVIGDGGVPARLLDEAAADAAGTRRGGVPGLNFGENAGGVVRPGEVRNGTLIGSVEQGAPAGAGSSAAVKKPVGNASVSPPQTSGGNVPNVGGTVAGLRGGFKACYRRGLEDEDPMMQGTVRVTAKIGPNGDVLSATPSGASGLSSKVVGCVVGRVAGARFEPPEGGFAIVVIPISFVRQ
ncbi:MAG: AgmX/PglI C-terminal domain-containing protein [Polyangiaceae bacterium]|nr:AgmX/PglI C-terminal domain-containing protein [Polyangiaceae bacterium]